jgi:hypothetical protein
MLHTKTMQHKEKTSQQNLRDTLNELSGKVEGPEDWSKEHDHYLYGIPKQKKIQPKIFYKNYPK